MDSIDETKMTLVALRRRHSKRLVTLLLAVLLAGVLVALGFTLSEVAVSRAAGTLTVEIVSAYNLVVDSNVGSPSTYAPRVATVIGRFCNTATGPGNELTNVYGYIGDYVPSGTSTPGIYPVYDSDTETTYSYLDNTGDYFFRHVGSTADATRFIGTIPAGDCRYQYWTFEYPACENVSDTWQEPPCAGGTDPLWGPSVKPDDDFELSFDVWGTSDQSNANTSRTMTMRNEISAMANKIEPNGNPPGRWFNTENDTVSVGDVITTNGVLYSLGNVRFGFDNDEDYVPDYNAWVQPISQPDFDPSCFRLIRTRGVLTVTRGGDNPDMIINFTDQLYFTDLPPDNTNVRGEVYYTYLALDGPCNVSLSPYQEVASGFDNEKFNGDYGTGIPPIVSLEPDVTIDKSSAPSSIAVGGSPTTYNIPFANPGLAPAGLTLSSSGVNMPLVISDTVPNGMQYVADSATYSIAGGITATIRYSTDSGASWSTTDPGTTTSAWPDNKVIIQWWLGAPLPAGSSGDYAQFQAQLPSGYAGNNIIENTACIGLGDAAPFACDTAITLVQGTGQIGNRVWRDDNGNGIQDTSETTNIDSVALSLYWDKNGNGFLDSTDVLIATQDSGSTTDSDETNTNYNFTGLPNGGYLVKVDKLDPDIDTVAQGYTLTTIEVYTVTLSTGSNNYNDADFGFGPTLEVNKHLDSLSPAYVNEEVIFHINLYNILPGDGTANGYCQYTIWPTIVHVDDTLSPPGGSGANKQWTNTGSILGRPNNVYASTDMEDADEMIGLSGFNRAGTGNITKVETIVYFREDQDFINNSTLYVRVWDDGLGGSLGEYSYDDTYFSGGAGTEYIIRQNVTSLRAGGWTWSHFASDITEMQIEADKGSGSDGGEVAVDAVAYIVTTDQLCSGNDTVIAVLPLTDTYDADLLEFLYADPPVSNATTSGTAPNTEGILTWDNLGPLYAGGVRPITVTFRALATAGSPGTTDTASVTNAKFASGRDVNDGSDDAQVPIVASGSIVGTVWADGGATAGWLTPTPSNGYDGSDTFIPDVKVELYACYSLVTSQVITSGMATTGKDCEDSANNGEWRLVATDYTDGSGNYAFTGLRDGYYNVEINDGSAPTGFPTRRAEASPAGNGAGTTCGTCDGLWNSWTANLSTFNYLDNSIGGENIDRVNFGYINAAVGAVTGYIWRDVNADGVWDADEQPISGVTVSLTCSGSCPDPMPDPVTTDANGFYQFTDLPTTGASYQVVVTPPSGMSQSGDPDAPGAPCNGSCDDQTDPFSVTAGQVSGPYNFGYTGGLTIGDTVYTDWNGDGDQDSGEEGIQDVAVYLYRDTDGDGVVDLGSDPLLGSETTDASGFYEFTDLPGNGADYIVVVGGSSLPAGYTQTADPDESGTCSTCDSKDPITLGSSDYLLADFGYRPRGFSAIGDYVWLDSDGDAMQDASESGINGVTVNLYQDQDGDGVIDAEDALVASTTTGLGVIDGYTDVDGDSSITAADDSPALVGVRVIDGELDINDDGVIDTSDDGTYLGYAVIDGLIDIDGGGVGATDDGTLNGLYQFRDLAAGDYVVEIPSSNFGSGQPLEGLTQSYDQDSTTVRDNQDQVSLGGAENYVLGDFGYASSAIGDYVWQDSNADGNQDEGEPGISGVTVGLYTWTDMDGDGVYSSTVDTLSATPLATDITDADGLYLFSGLPAGDYVVKVDGGIPAGFTQSGDPDWLEPCTGTELCDGASGVSLQLGQTDMSRDFGYWPPGVIGDYVWFDNNGDGVQDVGEGGIGFVTVQLCSDVDCNTVLRTTQTDSDGYYSFGDLADGTYYVKVDASTLPIGVSITYDLDSGISSPDGVTAVTLSGGGSNLTADFGYRFTDVYDVGGTVFFDVNHDGSKYASGTDMGFRNLAVYLWKLDCSGTSSDICGDSGDSTLYIASTVTLFKTVGGRIDINGDGSANDSDDGVWQGISVINGWLDLNDSGSIETTGEDDGSFFGYTVVNGGLDVDNDGDVDSNDNADAGKYNFFDLPAGDYRTVVNSGSLTLNGMTLYYEPDEENDADAQPDMTDTTNNDGDTNCTTGAYSNTSCNSHAVVRTGDSDVLTQDYGFYASMDMGDLPDGYNYNILMVHEGPIHIDADGSGGTSIRLGTAWDSESDGQPSSDATGDDTGSDDEDGVAFLNAWAVGGTAQLRFTITDNDSAYNPYLVGWFDWNMDGDLYDAGEMIIFGELASGTHDFNVPIATTSEGDINMRFRLYATQSPPPVIMPTGNVLNGEVEDYQQHNNPTAVTLSLFQAAWNEDQVLVTWETALEIDTVGFNLWRSTSPGGGYVRVNDALIPAESLGGVMGGFYEVVDTGVAPGTVYYYKLEELEVGGRRNWYGPVSTGGSGSTSVILFNVAASGGVSSVWWAAGVVAVIGVPLVVLVRLWKRRR